jgi:hypothetical protein
VYSTMGDTPKAAPEIQEAQARAGSRAWRRTRPSTSLDGEQD